MPNPGIAPLATSEIVTANEQQGLGLEPLNRRPSERQSPSIETLVESVWAQAVDYPALADSVFAEDAVAFVVGQDLPIVNELAAALREKLLGHSQAHVDLVVSQAAWEHYWSRQTPAEHIRHHLSDDPESLALLSVGVEGQPIYINRVLFDADVVLPVEAPSPHGQDVPEDSIIPAFLGEPSQERLRELSEQDRTEEIEQLNLQLGAFTVMALILGPGNAPVGLLYGERQAVLRQAHEELQKIWSVEIAEPFPLVVATLESPGCSQSWDDVVHALIAADQCATPEGAIVITCDLERPPTKRIRQALAADADDKAYRTNPMLLKLSEIARRHPLYLHSRLKPAEVESWGFGCLASLEELKRLVARNGRGGLLRDAHHCIISVTQPELRQKTNADLDS